MDYRNLCSLWFTNELTKYYVGTVSFRVGIAYFRYTAVIFHVHTLPITIVGIGLHYFISYF